jgi:defect-in-organelle-trafficking protein DotD
MKFHILYWFLAALWISGCTTQHEPESHLNTQDEICPMLLQSAQQIEHSLRDLAQSEQFKLHSKHSEFPRIVEQVQGMEQLVSMPWQGPIEAIAKKLALLSHFEFKVMGRVPAIPILVHIPDSPATISDHLGNVGLQAGSRADVIVDPTRHIVELRYLDGSF